MTPNTGRITDTVSIDDGCSRQLNFSVTQTIKPLNLRTKAFDLFMA